VGSVKAREVLAALLRIGWTIKRESDGSHRILSRSGWPDIVFAFHDREEIGPKMLARLGKRTGLTPEGRQVTRASHRQINAGCPSLSMLNFLEIVLSHVSSFIVSEG
jgi:predicted RNA binding protein YcfA (HicA-like mRNA interferase family)